MILKKVLLLFFISGFILSHAFASHNRAGEITYVQISELTYQFTLTVYTEEGNVERPTATLLFGDGTGLTSSRISLDTIAPADGAGGRAILRNRYVFTHTFPGAFKYTVSYRDENRNQNVLNINNGQSINVPFYIETYIRINPQLGFNSTPKLLLEPIDFGVVGREFLHNPTAFDVDGDSLSFKLVECKQGVDTLVPNYKFPDKANGYASESFTIDVFSGEVSWKNPVLAGKYNIAIRIEEWRKGILIGYVIRDMQIPITNIPTDPNSTPDIKAINDTCILSGVPLNIIVSATDNTSDSPLKKYEITLIGRGGPFESGSPFPVFTQPTSGVGTINQAFSWSPDCDQVRREPYEIVFKVTDKGSPPLHDLETWLITVVAPGPDNFTVEPIQASVRLQWGMADCSKAIGYRIYRRLESFPFIPENCETGVPAFTGYKLIKTIKGINNTGFLDDDNGTGLAIGQEYCYRITTIFADDAESYSSIEVCTTLKKDLPVITHVSVAVTSISAGVDSVRWSKPTEIDPFQTPPPYEYKIYRAEHLPAETNLTFEQVQTYGPSELADLNDSIYVSTAINTLEKQHTYKIEFYSNGTLLGISTKASSVYLAGIPGDNKVILAWNFNVPWSNETFEVYIGNNPSGPFTLVKDGIKNPAYTVKGLPNDEKKCFMVKSVGRYPAGGYIEPIINNSQIICLPPTDNERPCPPSITVTTDCKNINVISWSVPDSCLEDIFSFRLLKQTEKGIEFLPLKEFSMADALASDFKYEELKLDESVAGCYYMLAVDSALNESLASNQPCVDNCPLYVLPNVFTPNGDGINDLFKPYPDSSRFIYDIRLLVYNRWGDLVYSTDKRDINWDGTHYISKNKLSSGVYYYTCDVNTKHIEGIKKKEIRLSGYVYIFAD